MPFKRHAHRRHHIPKQKHIVTKWREYDASLRQRGSLTVWFTDKAVATWKAEPRTTRGGQPHYSDLAIATALTLRAVFQSALRQTEVQIGSIMVLLGLDLALPDHSNGARVAVWTIVNVENWRPTPPMPRAVPPPPMGNPLLLDVPNWAWHEYPMRVGFWRFLEVLGKRGLKATFAVNGNACTLHEEACSAARDTGWEFMGHGFVQQPMHRSRTRKPRSTTRSP